MGYKTYGYMPIWKGNCNIMLIVIVWIINYFVSNKISTTQLFTFEMSN